ncbi:MAG TPA: type II toxin-antitoxin system RelE/ParE family toxin [Telluria sp.]|nr:type II toxin-antitoxin system RelE/ParE family toxin [Telluria sp.]
MIRKWRHKGLRDFFKSGTLAGIETTHASRLRELLLMLDEARSPNDMHRPGFKLHRLHGSPVRWSVWVSGNWRLTFEFDDGDARNVDYEDYH